MNSINYPAAFFFLVINLLLSMDGYSQNDENKSQAIDFDTSVRLALENSYEVLISKEEITAAAGQLENAKRAFYPKVSLQSSARADLFSFEDWSSKDVSTGLVLDWDPYQGGEAMRRNAEAKMNFYIAKLGREKTVMDIVLAVQKLYYELLKAQYAFESDAISLRIEKQKLDTQESEFKAGRIKEADILSARTAYYEKELAYEKAKQEYGVKIINMQNKIQNSNFAEVAEVERNIIYEMDFSLESCINTAYVKEREYLAAKEREKLARLGVKYSRLKKLPSFSFFTTNDYAIDQSFGDEFGFRIGVIASYPLYDAGGTASIIRNAESYLRKAELDFRREKEKRTLDVSEKYFTLKNQIELLKITREKEKRFAEDYTRAEMDFKNGSISKIDYDKFQYAFELSNNRIKELELDVMLAQSELLMAMGICNFSQIIK